MSVMFQLKDTRMELSTQLSTRWTRNKSLFWKCGLWRSATEFI